MHELPFTIKKDAKQKVFGITGSIIWNDAPPAIVSGYKVYFDFGNTSSYPGSGSTVTNLGSGGSAMNGTLVNSPTWSSTNGGILDLTHDSQQYIRCVKAIKDNVNIEKINNSNLNIINIIDFKMKTKVLNVFKLQNGFLSRKLQVTNSNYYFHPALSCQLYHDFV